MEYVVGIGSVLLSSLLAYLLAFRFGIHENVGAMAIFFVTFVIAFFTGLLGAIFIDDRYR